MQCARVNNDMVYNASKYSEGKDREKFAVRSHFNFYTAVALALIIIAGNLKLFTPDVFIALFVATLVGLGVKLGYDLK